MKILYSNRGRVQIINDDGVMARHRLFECPRCEVEGWAGALAIAGTVAAVGAGATVYSADQSANAQKSAANAAANSQNSANQLNYQMYQQSRGSTGSAIFPTYLTNNGSLFEPQLGSDLVNAYEGSKVPLSTFQNATSQLAPAEQGANTLTNGLFNGGVTSQMLKTQAPVNAQNLATAKNSSMDALSQTLNAIDSNQASRGYVGDSYANRLLSFQANQTAGNAVGAAQQQNLQTNADITNYGNVTLPLQNMQLPYTMAQTNSQEAFMPQDQWLQSIGQSMEPLNMLKIGVTGPFQYQPLPTPGPGAYSGAANALSSLGGEANGIGSSLLNYGLGQQNQQNFLSSQPDLLQNSTALGEYENGVSPSLYTSGAGLEGYNLDSMMGGGTDGMDASSLLGGSAEGSIIGG
jgi:hypothetical protein